MFSRGEEGHEVAKGWMRVRIERKLKVKQAAYILIAPKGETTHYDWCVALLLPIMFAVHPTGRYHPL